MLKMNSASRPPKHVLILEDDAHHRELLECLMLSLGYTTAVVGDVGAAMTEVARLKPDLVITDLELPDATGYDFCDRLRASPALSAVPIVMVTGASDRYGRRGTMPPHVYLVKPYPLAELVKAALQLALPA